MQLYPGWLCPCSCSSPYNSGLHPPQFRYRLRAVEPKIYLPSDPLAHQFDHFLNPLPIISPNTKHGCRSYNSIGADITISCSPPPLSIQPTSSDVPNSIAANAGSLLQMYAHKKLKRASTYFPPSGNLPYHHDDALQIIPIPKPIQHPRTCRVQLVQYTHTSTLHKFVIPALPLQLLRV